jgi:peptidoglycan/LPS O-acetylase OafA/YrhL
VAGIDELRGLAILLVAIYHAGPLAWRLAPYGADGWLAWPRLPLHLWLAVPFLHFGFTGVHAFFVLSGFCIHLRAARARRRGETPLPALRPFFLRRFWRIYPPYWMALALFAAAPYVAQALGWSTRHTPPDAGDVALHAVMLHSLVPSSIFSINPAFWSLATEEQFYLAYPLLVRALSRWGMGRVLGVSLVVSLLWRALVLALIPPTVEHFLEYRVLIHALFLPRWYEWILGCWLAELCLAPSPLVGRRRPLAVLAALLLLAGMATRVHVAVDKLLSDLFFSSGHAALIGAVLAGGASRGGGSPTLGRLRGILGRALAALGRRAYGVYLMHQPILDLLDLPWLVRSGLAAAVSAVFSRFCERPFEERSRRLK